MKATNQTINRLKTFGVQFILRQDKLKDGKAPLYCRVTVNGEIVHFAVKCGLTLNTGINGKVSEKETRTKPLELTETWRISG